jgi:hypothetical protein
MTVEKFADPVVTFGAEPPHEAMTRSAAALARDVKVRITRCGSMTLLRYVVLGEVSHSETQLKVPKVAIAYVSRVSTTS